MRRRLTILALLAIAAVPLHAQDQPGRRLGIGLTFNPANLIVLDNNQLTVMPAGFNNFLVPIELTPQVTLEPEFGILSTKSSASSGGSTSSSTVSSLRLGAGFLVGFLERGGLRPYIGPRAGIIRSSYETGYTYPGGGNKNSATQTNYYVSGVIGAQYFFSRHFSLGGEVQLTYLEEGKRHEDPPPTYPMDLSGHTIGTSGLIIVRCFF